MFSQAPVVAMIGSGSYLGVGVREIDEERARTLKLKETHGVEITRVDDESPAHKAGLKSGDVVLEYNGDRVEGIEQFVRLVRETPANRTVKLSVFREGSVQALTATVGSRKGPKAMAWSSIPDAPNMEKFKVYVPPMEMTMPDIPKAMMSCAARCLGLRANRLAIANLQSTSESRKVFLFVASSRALPLKRPGSRPATYYSRSTIRR